MDFGNGEIEASPGKIRQWKLEYAAQIAVEWCARHLPGPLSYRFGSWIGRLAWHVLPARRRIVLRNLRIACGNRLSGDQIKELAKENFRRTGANLVSVAHTAGLTPDQLKRVMRVENLHLVEDALAQGRGVVLLLSHMGNWEMLSRIVNFFPHGTKTGAFYRPLNNPWLDRRVRKRREADGTRMFSKRDNALHVASFLREGAVVGILADQRVGPSGEVVDFFGRRTRGSALPSLMARRGRSELIALSLHAESPGRWVAVLESVQPPGRPQECMKAIENAMMRSLVDVFWLQDRWKVYPNAHQTGFGGWLPADLGRSEKPHRALIVLVGQVGPGKSVNQMIAPWLHPDLDLELMIDLDAQVSEEIDVTRVHQADAISGDADWFRLLERIDAADVLPLDMVLAPIGVPAGLRKAAKRVHATYIELI